MALNLNNFGIVSGRLTKDPQVFQNADGSQKVCITVAARRNYVPKDGAADVDYIDCEVFVPAGDVLKVLNYLEKGTAVTIAYTQMKVFYEDKTGKKQSRTYNRAYNNEIMLI